MRIEFTKAATTPRWFHVAMAAMVVATVAISAVVAVLTA